MLTFVAAGLLCTLGAVPLGTEGQITFPGNETLSAEAQSEWDIDCTGTVRLKWTLYDLAGCCDTLEVQHADGVATGEVANVTGPVKLVYATNTTGGGARGAGFDVHWLCTDGADGEPPVSVEDQGEATGGEIVYPESGGEYPDSTQVSWEVNCTEVVYFQLTANDVEACCDFIDINHAHGTHRVVQGSPFGPLQGPLTVVFTSDYAVNGSGFTLRWSCGTPLLDANVTTPEAVPEEDVIAPLQTPDDANVTSPMEDGNATTPVVTPEDDGAPVTPLDGLWCTVNADCTLLGDQSATCGSGRCTCGAGYGNPSLNGLVAYTCVADGTSVTYFESNTTVRVDALFRDGDCTAFTGNATQVAIFEGILRTALSVTSANVVYQCGSVLYGVLATVSNRKLAQLGSAMNQVAANVLADNGLKQTLGSMTVTGAATGTGLLGCAMAGATATTMLNGVCHAMTCGAGYTLSRVGAVNKCFVAPTPSPDSDDDFEMTPGIIVAVVLSSLAIIVSLVFIAKYVTSKKAAASPAPVNTLPNSEEPVV